MRGVNPRAHSGVELNVTAMLDTAFQLLAFFVLTFRPAPDEGQISLRLPPPRATKPTGHVPRGPVVELDRPTGVETLLLSIFRSPGGAVDYAVGDARFASLGALDLRLRQVFSDPNQPFRQVVVAIDEDVPYEQVLRVVERCTRQKLKDGLPLGKLSLVERR